MDYSDIPSVNLNRFRERFNQCHGVTTYNWGRKSPLMGQWPPPSDDCSGWLSHALILCGYPQDMPRSSHEMGDWFLARASDKALGAIRDETDPPFYKPASIQNVLKYALHDAGRLFVAGYDKGGTNRHIFSVCAGMTFECASGLHGVGSRNAAVFGDEIDTGDHFRWIVEVPVDLS